MTQNTEDKYDADIKDLFDRVSKHFDGANEGVQVMFSMLVKTALTYRDKLTHASGKPLTVTETRDALDAFMVVMKIKKIPEGLAPRVHGLVIEWLQELKLSVHN